RAVVNPGEELRERVRHAGSVPPCGGRPACPGIRPGAVLSPGMPAAVNAESARRAGNKLLHQFSRRIKVLSEFAPPLAPVPGSDHAPPRVRPARARRRRRVRAETAGRAAAVAPGAV